ncbi:hypothetical protein M1D72_04695 [Vibrio sp. AK197]|uniref:Phosphate ABC transporter substrate-binding protein n=1 Tax=Vibrio olivae TaxID=1243002 RepID=A0ABV5HPQ4_9VIBR
MVRICLAFGFLFICHIAFAEHFVVITKNNHIEPLRSNQVKMLYRGRISHLNGIPVKLVDLPDHSPTRQAFYSELLNKTPNQMNVIWARQSFSGKTAAPYELHDDDLQQVLQWLSENPNGVAYFPKSLTPSDVNILYTLNEKGEL